MNITIASTTSDSKNLYAKKKILDFLTVKNFDCNQITIHIENIYTCSLEDLQQADIIILIGTKPQGLEVPCIDGTAFIAKIPFMEEKTCEDIYKLVQEKLI